VGAIAASFPVYVRQPDIAGIMEPVPKTLLRPHLLGHCADFKQKHRLRSFSETNFRVAAGNFGIPEQRLTVPGAIAFADFMHWLRW
jgi:hypothetical protein